VTTSSAKIIIAGGRDFEDIDRLSYIMDNILCRYDSVEFVSGGAKGADTLGEEWARSRGYTPTVFKADWNKLGRSAGVVRNKIMAEYADYLVAFWDGNSSGTKNMIQEMKALGKHGLVCMYSKPVPNPKNN